MKTTTHQRRTIAALERAFEKTVMRELKQVDICQDDITDWISDAYDWDHFRALMAQPTGNWVN